MQIFPLDLDLGEKERTRARASRTKDPRGWLGRNRSAKRLGVDRPSWRLEDREEGEGVEMLFLKIVVVERELTKSNAFKRSDQARSTSTALLPPSLPPPTHTHPESLLLYTSIQCPVYGIKFKPVSVENLPSRLRCRRRRRNQVADQ